MHVGDEHHDRSQVLAAGDDAELGGLLDRVDGVAAAVGEPDDLGLGGLGLKQEGREIGRVERMLALPSTLPPAAFTTSPVSRSIE